MIDHFITCHYLIDYITIKMYLIVFLFMCENKNKANQQNFHLIFQYEIDLKKKVKIMGAYEKKRFAIRLFQPDIPFDKENTYQTFCKI